MRAFWGGMLWSGTEMNPYLVLYEDSPIIEKILKTFSYITVGNKVAQNDKVKTMQILL